MKPMRGDLTANPMPKAAMPFLLATLALSVCTKPSQKPQYEHHTARYRCEGKQTVQAAYPER